MSTSLIRGVDPNGEIRTVAVTEEGELKVSASGVSGGGGGGGTQNCATASNQLSEIARLEAIRDCLPNALISGRFKTISLLEPSENFLGAVGGRTIRVSATFNRPSDTIAYTALDGVSNSNTAPTPIEFAAAARVASGSGLVIAGKLTKSSNTTTNASFRLWLYTANPGTIPNDNAPFAINNSNRAIRIGFIDFSSFVAGGDCAESYANPSVSQIAFKLGATSSLFGILQAIGAYSPASGEQFFLDLSILQD